MGASQGPGFLSDRTELQGPAGKREPGRGVRIRQALALAALPCRLCAVPFLGGGFAHCSLISGSQ